ncbi:MAG: sulfotransferase [Pseudomonadota bacterium]
MTPSFMLVGAQKAGTTWLFECLNEHPEVFVPELKEVHFFCPPDRCRHSRQANGMEWYLGLFPDDARYKAVGEMTTDYMYYGGADDIHRLNPDMKIVFMLRHPVDRAYSAYWMKRRHSLEVDSFESSLDENAQLFERGCYHRQIMPFVEKFGAANVRVYIYEELTENPAAFFADLCGFLGVNPAFRPKSLDQRVGETKPLPPLLGFLYYKVASRIINLPPVLPLWRFLRRNTRIKEVLLGTKPAGAKGSSYQPMPPDIRRRLLERYRPENDALFAFLGRDIPSWSL